MHTAAERFHDVDSLVSYIESRTVREGRRAFAWQMAMQARRTRRERLIEIVTTTIAAAAWVGTILVVSGMMFAVGTE